MKFFKDKILRMNINRKIIFAMTSLLVFTSLFILTAFSLLSQSTLKKKSLELAAQQMNTGCYNTSQTLNDIHNISAEIVGNSWVQSYLRASHGSSENYTLLERSANEVLDNQRDSNSSLGFVSLIKYSNRQLMYSGITWTVPNFVTQMETLYQQSSSAGIGNMRYTLQKDIFSPNTHSFYFFMPVYNLFSNDEELGMLYLMVPEREVRAIYSTGTGEALNTSLLNPEGMVLSSADPGQVGQTSPIHITSTSNKGTLDSSGKKQLTIYQRLPKTNWVLVGEIPTSILLEDYKYLVTLSIIVILAGVAVAVSVAYVVSQTIYRPIGKVIQTMDKVAQGDLQVQIPADPYSEDLQRLVTNFNTMVRKVNQLMIQVKEEQREKDTIQFNMLQSQIQPHFLYNVLDSIHWQAAYNKDREVSQMVQTLANYYRLSLSKGNDIITLQQELDMVHNYLSLQNIRYDNLVTFTASLPQHLTQLSIPKLTLQPLIENTIYHGFRSNNIQQGTIRLWTEETEGDILLLLEDNGGGGNSKTVAALNESLEKYNPDAGYGLQNVQKRFTIYFGPKYGLKIDQNHLGGITVTIRLPAE